MYQIINSKTIVLTINDILAIDSNTDNSLAKRLKYNDDSINVH